MNKICDAHFKNHHCFRLYMFDSPTHDPISESHLVCGQHPLGSLKIFRTVLNIERIQHYKDNTTKAQFIENEKMELFTIAERR